MSVMVFDQVSDPWKLFAKNISLDVRPSGGDVFLLITLISQCNRWLATWHNGGEDQVWVFGGFNTTVL